MVINEITSKEYMEFNCPYIFCSSEFSELNRYKVDEVKYLLFQNNKKRFILCAGIQEAKLVIPFSAPFSMLLEIKEGVETAYFYEAVEALTDYAQMNGLNQIQITLPPLFYDIRAITLFANSLYSHNYVLSQFNLNFHLNLKRLFVDNYPNLLPRNARKNLKIALTSNLMFIQCCNQQCIDEAYEIIKENRAYKNKPLRMSLEQVKSTMLLVEHEVFVVSHKDICVAAAFVFHINSKIAQVIYWGDRPNHSELKSINYLSFKLIEFYGERNFETLDIGTSTEDSVANTGLCNFKESIGCEISPKWGFCKKL